MPLAEPLFSELIVRLDGESGMRRKVRVLASSWSLLRELSPQQRERLALAIGNRWAWRNIESLFGNTGELSENQRQVKAFFDDLRGTEPEELREIGKQIREGEFTAAKSRLLDAVGEALEEESEPEDDSQGAVEAEPESRREAPVVTPPVAPSVIEAMESEPAQRPSVTPPPVEPEPEPAIGPEESSVEPRRSDRGPLSAVESLSVLRQLSAGEAPSTRAGRAAMVRSLTSGWAARRAVSSIIRSHSAADLSEALALIRQLPTAAQQIWCIGDLVEHWDLEDGERRRVLAEAPTDSARRRLALRARRAV